MITNSTIWLRPFMFILETTTIRQESLFANYQHKLAIITGNDKDFYKFNSVESI